MDLPKRATVFLSQVFMHSSFLPARYGETPGVYQAPDVSMYVKIFFAFYFQKILSGMVVKDSCPSAVIAWVSSKLKPPLTGAPPVAE